jgi:GNAT superfamily N-acetyltransferase
LDPLTGQREIVSDPLPACYFRAFDAIVDDPAQVLLVAEDSGAVIGTLQVTFSQHLISRGLRRAVVEALFIHPKHQRQGAGAALMKHVIEIARAEGCQSIELTSNKTRDRAHAFYARMGFHATHDGFKLPVEM